MPRLHDDFYDDFYGLESDSNGFTNNASNDASNHDDCRDNVPYTRNSIVGNKMAQYDAYTAASHHSGCDFIFKIMNSVFKIMNFEFRMSNFALKHATPS